MHIFIEESVYYTLPHFHTGGHVPPRYIVLHTLSTTPVLFTEAAPLVVVSNLH